MSLASACALPAVSRAAVQGASNPKLLGRAAERGRSNAQARLQLPSCYRSIEYISVDLSQQTPDWLEGGGSGGAGGGVTHAPRPMWVRGLGWPE
jgi:hypothetical protein